MLADSRELVEPALRAAVDTLPHSMRQVAGYHLGWWDERGRSLSSVNGANGGGKAVRPALTLLSAEAMGAEPAAAVPAAVAVELTHNFSLLHDDVMDGDTTRRHRATAWTVYGREAAILGGDALLTLALDGLAASGVPAAAPGIRLLSAAVQELLAGQSADVGFERRADVSMAECLAMARRKTGALLGCACALGASFAGADTAKTALLRDFGQQLGLAFQHIDDLLGIWGDPEATGKPVHSDLRSRKKSLPVVAALTSGSAAGRELAALYHADRPLSGDELAAAAELIGAAGGRAYSRQQADELLTDALRRLDAAHPDPRAAAELRELARLVARRDR
ncbi:MAG: polyprenyl synthetase family protein [Micromonosporaceae bacterium]|nr:polyprenyl synthetase family protein [Micromonosporaceae bacterium]